MSRVRAGWSLSQEPTKPTILSIIGIVNILYNDLQKPEYPNETAIDDTISTQNHLHHRRWASHDATAKSSQSAVAFELTSIVDTYLAFVLSIQFLELST
jgi:hypothetical protein